MYETYLFSLAVLNLVRLTWQDYKNDMKIDDRYNYFVYGAVILFGLINLNSLWTLLITIGLTLVLSIGIGAILKLGTGDVSALNWINYSVGFLGLQYYLYFYAAFSLVNVFYLIYKRIAKHDNKPKPYFIVITISYIMFIAAYYLI